jgi:hypothetical protein
MWSWKSRKLWFCAEENRCECLTVVESVCFEGRIIIWEIRICHVRMLSCASWAPRWQVKATVLPMLDQIYLSNHHSSRLILSYHLLSCVFIVYCVYMYVCSPQHSWHCAEDENGKFIHNIVSFSKSLLCTNVNNLQFISVSMTVWNLWTPCVYKVAPSNICL